MRLTLSSDKVNGGKPENAELDFPLEDVILEISMDQVLSIYVGEERDSLVTIYLDSEVFDLLTKKLIEDLTKAGKVGTQSYPFPNRNWSIVSYPGFVIVYQDGISYQIYETDYQTSNIVLTRA